MKPRFFTRFYPHSAGHLVCSAVLMAVLVAGLPAQESSGGGGGEAQAEEEKAPSRYPGIDERYHPLLEEAEKLSPRLIPAWLEVRRLQAEWEKSFNTFGKQARRNAEREMASIERTLDRARKTFQTEFDRVRKPWLTKEENLRTQAAKLSERRPESSPERQQKRDEEISRLYAEAMEFYEKNGAVAMLEQAITVLVPPTRLDQLGVPRGSPILEALSREEVNQLTPIHLAVKDALADYEGLQKLKTENPDTWKPMNEQQLLTAERELYKTIDNARRVIDRMKKKYEQELAKQEKKLESVIVRFEKTRPGSRMSDKLDTDAAQLRKDIDAHKDALEAIGLFGGWAELEAKWSEKEDK